MALKTKTFAGSELTPTGDAEIAGGSVKITATLQYHENFESYDLDTTPPDWVFTSQDMGTAYCLVKEVDGQKVLRNYSNGWGGCYYSGTTFGDGCLETLMGSSPSAVAPTIKFNPALTNSGYHMQTQWQGGDLFHNIAYRAIPNTFIGAQAPTRLHAGYVNLNPHRTRLFTSKIFVYQDTINTTTIRHEQDEKLLGTYRDLDDNFADGYFALQTLNGYTDLFDVKFYAKRTGGINNLFTPLSITKLNRISVDWRNENSCYKNLSEVFEYQIDGGPWIALPDDGIINATCTHTIGLRTDKLENNINPSGHVYLDSVSIEIDGDWEKPAIRFLNFSKNGG